MEKKMYYDKELMLHAFERMDINNSGYITVKDLLEILGINSIILFEMRFLKNSSIPPITKCTTL